MHQSPDDFPEYRDSPPEYRGYAQEINYAHPEYYQQQEQFAPPVQSSGEAQPKHERPPAHNPYAEYAGYTDYVPTIEADPYTQEYRGPQQMENYTPEVSSSQQMEGYTPEVNGSQQQQTSERAHTEEGSRNRGFFARIGGALVAIGAFLLKFGTTSFSILVSVAVYALFYGWTFAIGIVASLFVHEMGHAVMMKLKGIPVGGLIFIPMFGAAVTMKQMPKNVRDEAEVAIAGPIAGALAASFCLLLAQSHGGPSIWAPLAYFGFFINLFNMIPTLPFDGGRVLAALDRRIWFLGFLALLGFQVWQWLSGSFSIWLLIIVLLAASQLWSRRMAPKNAASEAYYNIPISSRIALTLLYFGLIIVLVLGMTMAHGLMLIP